jgi:hypothetical protein
MLRSAALIAVIVTGLELAPASALDSAAQTNLVGPPGSGSFGRSVTALPNGNIVVTDPYYDAGTAVDIGAVYLYDGATKELISTLTGATSDDRVGYDGVTVLTNGNYVVHSPDWDNGEASDAGAATWGDKTIGVSGVVSSTNSLVGSSTDDHVGSIVTALTNGNYVVDSPDWDNGDVTDAGAVTWVDGTATVTGVVSSTNSLVGSAAGDRVGYGGVKALSNGNYVALTPYWDNGGTKNAGAVTWGDGTIGLSDVVSSANSLVGSLVDDLVGLYGVTELSNGNYVVVNVYWDNGGTADAGAVTWGDGKTGVSGVISSANSLVGSMTGAYVGAVTALSNGNYVVSCSGWDNGGATDVGAVTWGDGAIGVSGIISSTNSLVGSTPGDRVGSGVAALTNGNYVVNSFYWDDGGTADVGAVTWGDGTTAISGVVSSTNSFVGSSVDDRVGSGGVTTLNNGNYVVSSPAWDNAGATDAGAVTWLDGTAAVAGIVSSANSLVGSKAGDRVGYSDLFTVDGVVALSNGNYVVSSYYWDNGGTADAGAVTWGDGTTGVSGVISSTNSLVGSSVDDHVGSRVVALNNANYVVGSHSWDDGDTANAGAATWGDGAIGTSGVVSSTNSLVGSSPDDRVGDVVLALSNGNYVVRSCYWDNGEAADAGAVTWCDGTTTTSAPVSSSNSLVGSTADDRVGLGSVAALSHGEYAVLSSGWNNGGAANAGAVTWGNGLVGTRGVISAANSVLGTAAGGGSSMVYACDDTNGQLVVGRPADNIVTLFKVRYGVYLPLVVR